MAKLPWIERKFAFEFDVATYPDVIERFRGTPARIEDRLRDLPRPMLTAGDGKGWTIQENIGHLLDLETLFDGRLDDYLDGKHTLRAADMTNQATKLAQHNRRDIDELLAQFRSARGSQTARLESLPAGKFSLVAIHPRLKMPLRLVDAVTFVCEHDDYHLARIAEIIRNLGVIQKDAPAPSRS